MSTYLEFDFNNNSFTQNEVEAIELMKEMLKVRGLIFDKQFDPNTRKASFYPENITKEQILQASSENSQILNPYTIIKMQGDQLMVVPYCIEYKEELSEIRDLSLKAAALIEEPGLKGYLIRLAKACEDDSWEELENYWLTLDGNEIDLQLAPIEAYVDELLNIKHAFQGSLRVYSNSKMFNPDGYVDTVKAINFTSLHEEPQDPYNVVFRVDDLIAVGGNCASDPSISSNYPNDPEKLKVYGTKILIYVDNVIAKQRKTLLPLLEKVVNPDVLSKYTNEEYEAAFVRNLMVHEIAEAFIKYPNASQRLKNMNLPVQELHSTVVGLKIAAQHVLQGALSGKDYEVMLLTAFIGKALYYFYKNENKATYSPNLNHYIRGYTLAFNYMLDRDAIIIDSDNGLINIDYAKAFACMDQLAIELDEIKAHGTEKEAKSLFDKYENYSFYEDFRDKVKE